MYRFPQQVVGRISAVTCSEITLPPKKGNAMGTFTHFGSGKTLLLSEAVALLKKSKEIEP
jgi:hypothetical protein